MIIQKVLQTDLTEILALQKHCYLQEAAIYDDYNLPPLLQTIASIEEDFRQQVFLKLVFDEQIIGSVRAYLKDGVCKIGRLIVHPNFQNQGIGKRLMEAIEKEFLEADKFELFTGHRSSKNLAFYKKLGYLEFKRQVISTGLELVFLEKIVKNDMLEKIAKNEKLWDNLVVNDVLCSQPKLALTPEKAKAYLLNHSFYNADLSGQKVLCLASGGGQQSIGFALLDATVTVVDFSAEQLKKDRLVAEKYGKSIRCIKTDMQDLSMLSDNEFDIVYQPYSINYIPSVEKVFDEITRVLKPNGIYQLMFHNPFVHGSWKDGCWGSGWQQNELWQGKGYPIWQPYQDGYPIKTDDPNWNFTNNQNQAVKLESPQEYRHTLSTILNGLISRRFNILSLKEEVGDNLDSPPGTWEHYKSCAPPWMYLFSKKTAR